MTPQILFGANFDLEILNTETKVKQVAVANSAFNYYENQTRTIPTLGIHGHSTQLYREFLFAQISQAGSTGGITTILKPGIGKSAAPWTSP